MSSVSKDYVEGKNMGAYWRKILSTIRKVLLGNHERSIVELSIANATEIHSFRLDSCESVVTRFGSPCARLIGNTTGGGIHCLDGLQ